MDQPTRAPLQDQIVDEMRAVVAAGEELLHHTKEQAGEEYRRSRAKFETLVAEVKQQLASAEEASFTKARLAAAKADLYVHTHPWQTVGFGVSVAAVIGMLAGLLIGRR